MSRGIGITGYGFSLSPALPMSAVAGLCVLSPLLSLPALAGPLKLEGERKMLSCLELACVDGRQRSAPSREASEVA